jgi:hypothetical protein
MKIKEKNTLLLTLSLQRMLKNLLYKTFIVLLQCYKLLRVRVHQLTEVSDHPVNLEVINGLQNKFPSCCWLF